MPFSEWQDGVEIVEENVRDIYSNSGPVGWEKHGSNIDSEWAIARFPTYPFEGFNVDFGAIDCSWHLNQVVGMVDSLNLDFYSGTCPTENQSSDGNTNDTTSAFLTGYRYEYNPGGPGFTSSHEFSTQIGEGGVAIGEGYDTDFENPTIPDEMLPSPGTYYEFENEFATLKELRFTIESEFIAESSGDAADQSIDIYRATPNDGLVIPGHLFHVIQPNQLIEGWLSNYHYGYGVDTFQAELIDTITGEETTEFVMTAEELLPWSGLPEPHPIDMKNIYFYFIPPLLSQTSSPGNVNLSPDAETYVGIDKHWAPAIRMRVQGTWISPRWRYFQAIKYGWGVQIG